jgi:hypothetical protein
VQIYNMVRELSTRHELDLICAVEGSYQHSEEAGRQLEKQRSSVTLMPLLNQSLVSRLPLKGPYLMAH